MDEDTKNLEIAYLIPHDLEELTLRVRHSANAWWKDTSKVFRLLLALEDHGLKVDDACDFAGITKRQYKYFVRLHPILPERIKAAKRKRALEKLIKRAEKLEASVYRGGSKAAIRFFRFMDPYQYDNRFRNPLSHLRRLHKIPARRPLVKSEFEKRAGMDYEVEKTRAALGHPATPEHYRECSDCAHFLDLEKELI